MIYATEVGDQLETNAFQTHPKKIKDISVFKMKVEKTFQKPLDRTRDIPSEFRTPKSLLSIPHLLSYIPIKLVEKKHLHYENKNKNLQ